MEIHETYRQNFKVDREGRTIWFPYSCFGKGYLLTDEAKQKIARQYRNPMWFVYGFLAFLVTDLILVFALHSLIPMSKLIFFVLLMSPVIPVMIWARLWVDQLTANLTVSPMKMTFAEWLDYELLKQYSNLVTFCMVSFFFAAIFPFLIVWEALTWTPDLPWEQTNIAWGCLFGFWLLYITIFANAQVCCPAQQASVVSTLPKD